MTPTQPTPPAPPDRLGASLGAATRSAGGATEQGRAVQLKSCTDAARQFAVNVIQSGGVITQATIDEAGTVDNRCSVSDDAYQELIQAIRALGRS